MPSVAAEYLLDVADVYRGLVYSHENTEQMQNIWKEINEQERSAVDNAITPPKDRGERIVDPGPNYIAAVRQREITWLAFVLGG